MHVRTYYENYRIAAGQYMDAILNEVKDLQFTQGGPIIAIQVMTDF